MNGGADPWPSVTLARIPVAGLPALAGVRHQPDVFVQVRDEFAWVHWPPGRLEVVRALWPAVGVLFFRRDGEDWLPFGKRLPTVLRPPATEKRPLASVILPGRLDVSAAPNDPVPPLRLGIARGGLPEPATALLCGVGSLAAWADTATTHELGQVQAARSFDRVLLLGRSLPPLPRVARYWGQDVLVPVGYRVCPALPAAIVREAAGAEADDLVLLGEEETEVIPRSAFAPLTRAGARLALAPPGGA